MNVLRVLAGLALALAGQAALGRVWPGVHRWIDLLLVPVAVCATGRSHRTAMLVGCASGLLTDAWFHVGSFGASAFRRTFLGWLVAWISSRLDAGPGVSRFGAGAALGLADALLEPVMLRLLDLHATARPIAAVLVLSLVTGLAAVLGGGLADTVRATPDRRRSAAI